MGNMRTMAVLVIWVMAALGDASRRRLHSWERNRLGWPRSRSPSGAGSSGRAIIAGRRVSSTSSEAEDDDDGMPADSASTPAATEATANTAPNTLAEAVAEEAPLDYGGYASEDVECNDGADELALAQAQFDALPRDVRQPLGGLVSLLVQMLASFGRESR